MTKAIKLPVSALTKLQTSKNLHSELEAAIYLLAHPEAPESQACAKLRWSRAKYYRFKDKMVRLNLRPEANGNRQAAPEVTRKRETKSETKRGTPKDGKIPFGNPEYAHSVRLTEEEHQKLIDLFGEDRLFYLIEEILDWAEQSPKKFLTKKSHNLLIRSWNRRKVESGKVWFLSGPEGAGYYPEWVVKQATKK